MEQLKIAVAWYVVPPLKSTKPFSGAGRVPQSERKDTSVWMTNGSRKRIFPLERHYDVIQAGKYETQVYIYCTIDIYVYIIYI